MNIPTRTQIERLIGESAGPYVSVYMPTHRCSTETAQDPIRMKNLIRSADQQLRSIGCTNSDVEQIMSPLVNLVGDYQFWQHQMDGLMAFRSRQMFELYRVDMPVPELAVVSERPHLKPMLALISNDACYYVLSLSQNHARLYHGSREGLKQVEVDGMPGSLEETWHGQGEAAALNAHSASSPGGNGQSVVYHGQGSGDEVSKERLQIYFRKIDHALHSFIPVATTPLILATVDYLAPIYQKVNSLPGLQPSWASGSPDSLSAAELHTRTLPIALECFAASRRKAADRYLELWHTQRASNDLTDVLPAAVNGRVEALFAAVGVQIWGAYNVATGEVLLSEDHTPERQDLLNVAAIHAYLNGGSVFAVPPEEVPGGGTVAAVYRY